nr:MAK10-like protein [Tanacetum cinerariifolium]
MAAGGKLQDKSPKESWKIVEDLALHDGKSWNDPIDIAKPVKTISLPQDLPKTFDRRLFKLEDQINYLLNGSKTTPKTSSTQPPQAYANMVSSDPCMQNFADPPKQNSFTFQKQAYPELQPQTLEPSFEARVQNYMVAHTERMKRFDEAIFKQREEINEQMTEMFSLLKEYIEGKSPEKVLVREEVSKPFTKYVNAMCLVRVENEKGKEGEEIVDKNVVELIKVVEKEKVVEEVEDNKSNGSVNEDSTR